LTVVAVNTPEGDRFKLFCPNCRYSTTSAGMPEFESVTEFKLPSISACDYFEDIYKHFEEIASYEKEEQESLKYPPRKRKSNLLAAVSGLGTLIKERKAALEPPPPISREVFRDDNEEEINYEEYDDGDKEFVTYNQKLGLLYITPYAPFPSNMVLRTRFARRCDLCNCNLVRGDYNPGSVNFRAKFFGSIFIPELRIVHPLALIEGVAQPAFFFLSNNSRYPVKFTLKPINVDSDDYVNCQSEPIEAVIPISNTVADVDEHVKNIESVRLGHPTSGCIVFRKRHRIAIHMEVTAKASLPENFLLLQLDFESVISPEQNDPNSSSPNLDSSRSAVKLTKPPTTPVTMQIRVNLGPSRKLKEGEQLLTKLTNDKQTNLLKQNMDESTA